MSEIKATNGFLSVTGKIVGLNNKTIKEYPKSKSLRFGIQTKRDGIIFVEASGYIKNDDDKILVEYVDENKKKVTEKVPYGDRFFLEDGRTIIGTKIKRTPEGEVESVTDIEGVEIIKETFRDGQTVFLNLSVEPDTYFKNLKFNVKKIYASSKELNFEDENFVAENHGRLWLSYLKAKDMVLSGLSFNKKSEAVTLNFDLDTKYIKAEDFDFEQGKVIQIEFETNMIPQYEDAVVEDKKDKSGFTPKGKYASEVIDGGRRFPQITGYEDVLICTGISNAKEDVYDLTPFLEVENSEEEPF